MYLPDARDSRELRQPPVALGNAEVSRPGHRTLSGGGLEVASIPCPPPLFHCLHCPRSVGPIKVSSLLINHTSLQTHPLLFNLCPQWTPGAAPSSIFELPNIRPAITRQSPPLQYSQHRKHHCTRTESAFAIAHS